MRGIRFLLACLALLVPITAAAQIDAFNGFCTQGGKSVTTQGLSSTNKAQIIIPSCTVDVYLTGTTNHAAIYSDSLLTPLANPFTADNLSAVAPGRWSFYAANGVGYDVVMSGGIPPLTFTAPVTLVDLKVGGGGGGTGVTNFSAGNMHPLFTTTVTNPGTTPNLAFNLSDAPANTLFGNFTGTSGPPFFATFTCTGLLTCTYDNTTNIWNVNIPSTSTLSITASDCLTVNGASGPVSSGTAALSGANCGINTLTTKYEGGYSQIKSGILNIPADLGGNVYSSCPFSALVGAWTDNLGNVVIPICLDQVGSQPLTIYAPTDNVYFQFGVNDNANSNNTGSWTISANGTNYTIPATTLPWNPLQNDNTRYAFTDHASAGTSPVITSNHFSRGNALTITYVSGTVTNASGCPGTGSFGPWTPAGQSACRPWNGDFGLMPGFWAMEPNGGNGGGSGITELTGAVTAGPGTGSQVATIANTGVAAGSYTNTNLTVGSDGRITAASNGSGGSGLSGQTTNYLPKATSATASTTSSIVEDQGTGIAIHGTSTTQAIFVPPSTGTPTPVASDAGFGADSSGNAVASDNGGAFARVCTATNGQCSAAGGSVSVNGSGVSNPNFNGTTPSVAGSTGINNTYQVSSSSVSSYTPVATGSTPGVIKPDGSSCTVTAGVLTCPGGTGATSIPICADSSGSGTAQSCNTSPTFTPTAGSVIAYTTTTSNTGTGLTINVNSLGAKSVAKYQTTTTLAANDIRSGVYVLMTYNGTNWAADSIGNAPTSATTTNMCSLVTLSTGSCSSGKIPLPTGTSVLTISSIPQTSINLKLNCVLASNLTSAQQDNLNVTVNGDSTAGHYSGNGVQGYSGGAGAAGGGGTSFQIAVSSSQTGQANPGSVPTSFQFSILDYANSSIQNRSAGAIDDWTGTQAGTGNVFSGYSWRYMPSSATAIASLTLTLAAGTAYNANSSCTLYGEN